MAVANSVSESPITIDEGCVWEGRKWEIHFNVKSWDGETVCRHAIEGNHIPRVVVAYNEGGYCDAGVCLDCILEAAAKLENNR